MKIEIKNKRQVGSLTFFSVRIDDCLEISDCKIVQGSNGLFVAGPAVKRYDKKTGGDKWFDQVWIGKALQGEIISSVNGDAQNDQDYEPAFDADDLPY